jgi:NTE family protein
MPGKSKTVSLVLGSGAARGLAHIGVIESLNEQGYEIRSIAGASMGALVGGIYAAGELDAYKHWVLALERADVLRYLDLSFSFTGLFKGERLMDALREIAGERNIEDLPITYTAVATDLERRREVWFSRGSLFDAIRASIAIPTVFTPHTYRGRELLDGGLLNPVPIAPTFSDMTDLTIAVNLNGAREYRKRKAARKKPQPPVEGISRYREAVTQFLESIQGNSRESDTELGFLDLLNSSFDTMQNAISTIKLATYAPDVLIEIPRDSCKAYEFDRAAEMIALGYELAETAISSHGD